MQIAHEHLLPNKEIVAAETGKSDHGTDNSEDKENNTKEAEPKISLSEGLNSPVEYFEQHSASAMDILFNRRLPYLTSGAGLSVKLKKP